MTSFPSRLRALFGVFFRYFLRGVFLFLPALATFYVLWLILSWLDNILPTGFPGLGIVLLVVCLTLLGYIGTHWLGPTLIVAVEERIRKVPFIGFIYSSVRELVESSQRSFRFDRPVLVRTNPATQTYQIGFLTHEQPLTDRPLVAVYIPYSFGFMGDLVFVPADQVEHLPLKSSEALRFVIAGGLISGRNSGEKKEASAPDDR
ncbi:MAG: DUF502 domain-containing protein [Bacteroidia bacterium]|nr:DUF502 domain-containing protein [Bacteroidia bacterium]